MTRDEIKNLILRRAYAGAFEDGVDDTFNLNKLAVENGIEKEEVWKAFQELEDAGLIQTFASGGMIVNTTAGLLYCENHGLVDPELVDKQMKIRTKLAVTLYDIKERSPYGHRVDWEELIKEAGINNQDFANNERFMKEVNLIQEEGYRSYSVTAFGIENVKNYKARVQRVYEFDKLDKLEGVTEQQRGHKLEDFISGILNSEGWDVDKRERAQGQEIDIIIHKELDYFFISCKWEKEPVQPKELELMLARALSRKDVKGSIVVSISGFTDNCINEIVRRMEICHILIFGLEDITAVLSSERTFTALIQEKYKEVMLHRRILLDGKIRDVKPVPENK